MLEKTDNKEYWRGCGEVGILIPAGGNVKGYSALGNFLGIPPVTHRITM